RAVTFFDLLEHGQSGLCQLGGSEPGSTLVALGSCFSSGPGPSPECLFAGGSGCRTPGLCHSTGKASGSATGHPDGGGGGGCGRTHRLCGAGDSPLDSLLGRGRSSHVAATVCLGRRGAARGCGLSVPLGGGHGGTAERAGDGAVSWLDLLDLFISTKPCA